MESLQDIDFGRFITNYTKNTSNKKIDKLNFIKGKNIFA